jgi:hypothetical protein
MTEVAGSAGIWVLAALGFVGGALVAAGGLLLLLRYVRRPGDARPDSPPMLELVRPHDVRPYPRPIPQLLPHAVKIIVAGGILVMLAYVGLILSAARIFRRP